VKILLDAGADFAVRTADGTTLAYAVLLHGSPEMARLFDYSMNNRLQMRHKQLQLAQRLHKEAAMVKLDEMVMQHYRGITYDTQRKIQTQISQR